jgi:drug/metabolite transporter (DMT)-like permease
MRTRLTAYALLGIAAVVFGAIFSVNKLAAEANVPPLTYGFWQSLAAGLFVWVVAALKGERLAPSGMQIINYAVMGSLGIGIPISLLTYAAPHLPASLLTIVLALSPPLTFLLGMLVRIERFRFLGLLGLAFGFLGVLVIVGPVMSTSGTADWRWFLLSLLAPMFFACSNIAATLLRPLQSSSLSMAAGMLLGSSAVLTPAMLLAGQTWAPDNAAGFGAIFMAVVINSVFYVLLFEIIRIAGPIFFAQFNYLAVLAGVLWSMFLFGERVTGYFFIAMLLMFIGVFLSVGVRPATAVRTD